jgi:hypothetical protein
MALNFQRLWQDVVSVFGRGETTPTDEVAPLTIVGCASGTSSSCGGTPVLAQNTIVGGVHLLGVVTIGGSLIQKAKWAQRDYGEKFSDGGPLRGRTVQDVADALKSGAMTPDDVRIDVIVRDGNPIILNTRSANALIRAGIPHAEWVVVDRTGEVGYEARLDDQLENNGLGSDGFDGEPAARPLGHVMP